MYFGYPLGRYLGGVVSRIKFDGFYRYSPGELGLKIEYTSYLKVEKRKRMLVFGIPKFWILFLILIQIIIVILFNPIVILDPIILLIVYILSLVATYRIKKTGELYRFIREIKIAREKKLTNN